MGFHGVQLWNGETNTRIAYMWGFGINFGISGLALTLVSVKRFGSGLNCFLIQLIH